MQLLNLPISHVFQCILHSEIFLMVPILYLYTNYFLREKFHKIAVIGPQKLVDQALTGKIFKFCLAGLMQLLNLPISHVFQCILHSEIFLMVPILYLHTN